MHLVECVSFCNTTKLLTFLENEDEKVDWMSVINASIEGSPAQVEKLRRSFRERYNRFVRMLNKNVCSRLKNRLCCTARLLLVHGIENA